MHPGTLIVILLVLCAVGAVVAAVAVRRGNARRRVSREEFARQIGAREHDPRSGTRPSFGHFPEKDRYTGVPFTYAMEFTRSGVPVVASEVRSGGPNTQVRHVGTVQVPSGLPVDAPPLMVGEHWRWVIDPDTLQRVRALDGFPDSRIRAMCGDEEFARRVVTPELAAVFAAHRRMRCMPTVTFEQGVISTSVGMRLAPESLLRGTDMLIEMAAILRRQQGYQCD